MGKPVKRCPVNSTHRRAFNEWYGLLCSTYLFIFLTIFIHIEYNNMRFDASTHTWRGNEGNVNAVLERPTPRRQPMIISGGKGYAPSRYAAVVGNSMIFNSESRSWVASHGPEHNELDAFEDLLPRRVSISGRPEHNAPEFQLPSIQEAIAQQDEHVRFMDNWLGLIKGFQ